MWRKLLILGLAATAVASAQTTLTEETAQLPALTPTAGTLVQVRAVQRYNKLRRGRDEQIAIFPVMATANCATCLKNPRTLHLNSLELNPVAGFTVRYGDGKNFDVKRDPYSSMTKGGNVFLLKLKADKNMPLGDYTITGKLKFFDVENRAAGLQEVAVAIPITVVDHNAEVAKDAWNYDRLPDGESFGDKVGKAIEIALLIPLVPFLFIFGLIECGSPFCED